MSENNETINVTNSTNSTNYAKSTIESDKNNALKEVITAFQEQELTAEELHFRFKCQRCGFRCCMHSQLDKVVFSPHCFAYIRKITPPDIFEKILRGKLIKFSCAPPSLPVVNINIMVCPFSTLHYNKQAKNLFQAHLNSGKNTFESEFQLFLVHLLHSLDTMYIEYRIHTSQKEPIMGILTPELIIVANKVWKRLNKDYSHLYFQKEISEYIVELFDFLRNTPNGNVYFETSCSIYPARPQMCRIHPLARKTTLDTTKEHLESKNKQIFINYATCPASAFTQGESLSAQQYLEHQNVQDLEYQFFGQINTILKQYNEFFQRLHPKAIKVFYQALVDLLYFNNDYQEDRKVFYQTLHKKFDNFINNLNKILKTSGVKE